MSVVRVHLKSVCLLGLLAACRPSPMEEVEVDFDAGSSVRSTPGRSKKVLRFAIAAIQSPGRTFAGYTRLLHQVGDSMGIDIELVHRRTYRETNDLLLSGEIDAALVCTGGYAALLRSKGSVEVLVVPVVRGAMTYRSQIIVPAGSPAARFDDLAGKRFAFTDELSLTGHLWPTYLASSLGFDPKRFFSSAYFTRSHDRSIEAVAKGFVSGAAVDGNIYADLLARDPALATRVRVLRSSAPFGIPPVVVSTALSADLRDRLRAALLALGSEPSSGAVLREVGIDRFDLAPADLYDSALAMIRATE